MDNNKSQQTNFHCQLQYLHIKMCLLWMYLSFSEGSIVQYMESDNYKTDHLEFAE